MIVEILNLADMSGGRQSPNRSSDSWGVQASKVSSLSWITVVSRGLSGGGVSDLY
jgi:hypothetical protein